MSIKRRLSVQSILKSNSLDDFKEEFESLLTNHERDQKSKQFERERDSIISAAAHQDNKSLTKPAHKKKDKKTVDELIDINSKLQTLQNILKYLPDETHLNEIGINDEEKENDTIITSGFLVVVGGNISEATRFYAELIGNVLYLKREPNSKIKQVITISFIESTALDQNDDVDDAKQQKNGNSNKKWDNGKYIDLFLAHLESRSANNSFKLFSPTGIYVVSASCNRDKVRFSKCIESQLLQMFDNETWFAKKEASAQLLPIEKSQFEIQIERHEQIMNSLTLTG